MIRIPIVTSYSPCSNERRGVRHADQGKSPNRPKIYPGLFLLLHVSEGVISVVQRTVMRWVVLRNSRRTRYYLAVCQKWGCDGGAEKALSPAELGAASFTWGENRLSRHRPIDKKHFY